MAYTTIDKPSDYFNTVLYTGNGGTNNITGVGFQPDWVWLKDRSNANSHKLYDGVRTATKYLISNLPNAEATQSDGLTSFDSDGFTLGSYAGTNGSGGGSGPNFVSWNWLASNTTASNTDGSITSTVSANTTAGFSVVSYTGTGANATVGHGLGEVVKCIIIKNRDQADDWAVGHTSIGFSNHLQLNLTSASTSAAAVFNSTAPTSTVFSIGTNHKTNASSEDYIAYCFAEKKGYSKFGTYTGNGNANGTFVYTGFKPAWVMVKETGVGNWLMKDNKRPTYNQNDQYFYANGSNSEFTNSVVGMDFLSNGFKCRGTAGDMNGSGTTVLYMAFAENPFVTSTGIPCTAR